MREIQIPWMVRSLVAACLALAVTGGCHPFENLDGYRLHDAVADDTTPDVDIQEVIEETDQVDVDILEVEESDQAEVDAQEVFEETDLEDLIPPHCLGFPLEPQALEISEPLALGDQGDFVVRYDACAEWADIELKALKWNGAHVKSGLLELWLENKGVNDAGREIALHWNGEGKTLQMLDDEGLPVRVSNVLSFKIKISMGEHQAERWLSVPVLGDETADLEPKIVDVGYNAQRDTWEILAGASNIDDESIMVRISAGAPYPLSLQELWGEAPPPKALIVDGGWDRDFLYKTAAANGAGAEQQRSPLTLDQPQPLHRWHWTMQDLVIERDGGYTFAGNFEQWVVLDGVQWAVSSSQSQGNGIVFKDLWALVVRSSIALNLSGHGAIGEAVVCNQCDLTVYFSKIAVVGDSFSQGRGVWALNPRGVDLAAVGINATSAPERGLTCLGQSCQGVLIESGDALRNANLDASCKEAQSHCCPERFPIAVRGSYVAGGQGFGDGSSVTALSISKAPNSTRTLDWCVDGGVFVGSTPEATMGPAQFPTSEHARGIVSTGAGEVLLHNAFVFSGVGLDAAAVEANGGAPKIAHNVLWAAGDADSDEVRGLVIENATSVLVANNFLGARGSRSLKTKLSALFALSQNNMTLRNNLFFLDLLDCWTTGCDEVRNCEWNTNFCQPLQGVDAGTQWGTQGNDWTLEFQPLSYLAFLLGDDSHADALQPAGPGWTGEERTCHWDLPWQDAWGLSRAYWAQCPKDGLLDISNQAPPRIGPLD